METTEKFCQDKAIYNAVVSSIKILDEPEKSNADKGAIPELLTDALSVSFDPHVGHDYLLDSDDRYLFYHRTEKKIPFDLEYFNKVTGGGLSSKTFWEQVDNFFSLSHFFFVVSLKLIWMII